MNKLLKTSNFGASETLPTHWRYATIVLALLAREYSFPCFFFLRSANRKVAAPIIDCLVFYCDHMSDFQFSDMNYLHRVSLRQLPSRCCNATGTSINEKLESVRRMPRRLFGKIRFSSLFISFMVNRASISMDYKQKSFFQTKNFHTRDGRKILSLKKYNDIEPWNLQVILHLHLPVWHI